MAQLDTEAGRLLESAREMDRRAPEMASVLCDQAIARAHRDRELGTRLRAEALALRAANRLGRGAASTERALAAVRAARPGPESIPAQGRDASGEPVPSGVLAELHVQLAACARAAGAHEVALRVLRPVLEETASSPLTRAAALVERARCSASGEESEPGGALDEAERLYVASTRATDSAENPGQDAVLVHRGYIRAVRAGRQRRRGAAAEAAEDARSGLELISGLSEPAMDTGEASGALVLELVHALCDQGRHDEAVEAAEDVLRHPIRATGASPAGWLRFAVATRIHLPAGQTGVAIRELGEAADSAQRNGLDALLSESLTTLSHVYESGADTRAALDCVRGAHAADRRWRRLVHEVHLRLLAEFPANTAPEPWQPPKPRTGEEATAGRRAVPPTPRSAGSEHSSSDAAELIDRIVAARKEDGTARGSRHRAEAATDPASPTDVPAGRRSTEQSEPAAAANAEPAGVGFPPSRSSVASAFEQVGRTTTDEVGGPVEQAEEATAVPAEDRVAPIGAPAAPAEDPAAPAESAAASAGAPAASVDFPAVAAESPAAPAEDPIAPAGVPPAPDETPATPDESPAKPGETQVVPHAGTAHDPPHFAAAHRTRHAAPDYFEQSEHGDSAPQRPDFGVPADSSARDSRLEQVFSALRGRRYPDPVEVSDGDSRTANSTAADSSAHGASMARESGAASLPGLAELRAKSVERGEPWRPEMPEVKPAPESETEQNTGSTSERGSSASAEEDGPEPAASAPVSEQPAAPATSAAPDVTTIMPVIPARDAETDAAPSESEPGGAESHAEGSPAGGTAEDATPIADLAASAARAAVDVSPPDGPDVDRPPVADVDRPPVADVEEPLVADVDRPTVPRNEYASPPESPDPGTEGQSAPQQASGGDDASPDSRTPGGLADLLTEALVAYESSRRGENASPEETSARPRRHRAESSDEVPHHAAPGIGAHTRRGRHSEPTDAHVTPETVSRRSGAAPRHRHSDGSAEDEHGWSPGQW